MEKAVKILYIDDSKTDRELVRHSFENNPIKFEIIAVTNREEFEIQLKNSEFDLILSDYNILGTSGLQVFDVVRSINESIPIIVITGTGSEEAAVELMKKGVSDYVIKTPSHIQKLPNTVISTLKNEKIKNEKLQAQKELEISLQKYKVLFESFPLGITITNDNGDVLETNKKSESLLGFSMGDLIKHKFNEKEWTLILPDGSPLSIAEYATVKLMKEKNIIENIEMGIVKKDKNILWLDVTAAPIPLDGYGVAITYNDISQKKLAEESLKKNEERLRFTLEATTDAIWDINLLTGKAYLSPRYFSILDYDIGDFASDIESTRKLLHPDDVENMMKILNEYYKNQRETHNIEIRMRSKKEVWKWILNRGKIVERDPEGKPIRLVGTLSDITERKIIEVDLKRKNRALRILSECNSSLVKIKDEKKLTDDICKKIHSIGGYPLVWFGLAMHDDSKSVLPIAWAGNETDHSKFMNITWSDTDLGSSPTGKAIKSGVYSLVRNVKSDSDFIRWLSEAMKNGYNSVLSLPLIVEDKTIGALTLYSKEMNGFDNEEIKLLTELASDLSYGIMSIRTKEGHGQLSVQLFQSQKSEAIGRLAGGIAHDFNNILTVILGNTELIPYKIHNTAIVLNHIEQIKNSAEKAAGLTHQLLAFSRKEIIQPKIINLNKHVSEMQKMLYRIIGEDILLNVNLEQNLMNIEADQSHLDQILMNLVVNAKDAMPNGGELTIRTKNIMIDDNNIRLFPKAKKGGHVILEVEDTGSGIDDEIISKIFDPFFTTKSSGKGTGLGLSVVDGIVNQNKGWIDVFSKVGKGTELKIYFPVTEQIVKVDMFTGNNLTLMRGNGEKILVLEDEKGIRELTNITLTTNGYQVFEAMNIETAFHVLESENGMFDLIFSDIILPDGSGIDFYEKASLKYSNLKVLFTSGYADEKGKWEKIQKNNYAFISKPYKILELLNQIKKQLS